MQYDVAVIGGGPGGYVAAIRAAQLGAKVALVEKDQLGGTCLNRGCIPTKALLASVGRLKDLQNCSEFGLVAEQIGFDFGKIMARKDAITAQLRQGIAGLLKSYEVDCWQGEATLGQDKTLYITSEKEEKILHAGKVVLATGSRPCLPSIPGLALAGVLTSDELLQLDTVPESLAIVGGGVVGLEFATIFQALGCQVTVLEMLPTILGGMDKDLVNRLGPLLRKQGLKIKTSTKVQAFQEKNGLLALSLATAQGQEELIVEKVLVCTGRQANVETLGLENTDLVYTKNGITVNEKLETNLAGVYAIGDVTGLCMLAHAASAAGLVAAQNACGQSSVMDFANIPACVFTIPELATVGLSEQDALAQGLEIEVSKFNYAGNGKALALGETDGFVKIIAAKSSRKVLGMHILGAHASDLIMEGALAVNNGLTAKQVSQTIHPHPTLSEMVLECAEGIFGEAIHQVRLKKK